MTRQLPARPARRGDPIFVSAPSKILRPEIRDFPIHDMNVTIRLNLLGWQLATFKIDLDMGNFGDGPQTQRAFDGACKRLSRRWVHAITS
jgi:hypothetical protein